jgi:TRAP-type C4-dicarboxylate transport system permease small subunit
VSRLTRWVKVVIEWFYLASQVPGQVMLLFMVLLISVDVFGRNFLGRSTLIATEMSGYLLVAMTGLGLAYTLREDKHITIEILTSRLSQRRQQQLQVIVWTVCIPFMAWLTHATWVTAMAYLSTGRVQQTTLAAPIWMSAIFVPIGFGMLTIAFVIESIAKIRRLRSEAHTRAPAP